MTIAVAGLYRHPIKGHGREAVQSVTLEAGKTMPWDRVWAVAHEAAKFNDDAPEWVPCANFSRGSKAPELMAITAQVNETSGTIRLTHPRLQPLSINPGNPDDAAALIAWTKPIMPGGRAASARIVSAPGRGMTDSDFPSISINSHASLDALSDRAGQDISPLRFRGNIWVSGLDPWAEFDLVGNTIRIGDAELYVREPIERCAATTANPDTGVRDLDTLALLREGWGHQNFGVYAEVTVGGLLAVNSEMVVL